MWMAKTPNFLTVLGLKTFQQRSKKSSVFLLSPAISLSQYVANPNNHLQHSCEGDILLWLPKMAELPTMLPGLFV